MPWLFISAIMPSLVSVIVPSTVSPIVTGLEMMKKWHTGHNEYFSHLEHVLKLPEVQ